MTFDACRAPAPALFPRALAICVAAGALALNAAPVNAEEGGSGHYLPGSMASFIDGVPATETVIARLNAIYYDGSVSAGQPLPIGGLDTVGAHATSWGLGLTVLWRPSWGTLSERVSYAMSATVPVVAIDVAANVGGAGPGGTSRSLYRSSSTTGLGDVVLIPLMLNFSVNSDVNVNFRVAGYAPSGSYADGRLANTGKNFWTLEPTVALVYLGQKNGIEVSAFLGADFNEKNTATDYRSGTQLHLDGTVAQHFPWMGGLGGAGLSAFYYQQVTADSGPGATFGPFEAKTTGLGPVVSYLGKVGDLSTVLELKWLHEIDTTKRLEGDTVWFKAVAKF